jgi:hypothetical protein
MSQRNSIKPFVLSLSKGSQGFDKLSPNGIVLSKVSNE